jgi:hypothetical protein
MVISKKWPMVINYRLPKRPNRTKISQPEHFATKIEIDFAVLISTFVYRQL